MVSCRHRSSLLGYVAGADYLGLPRSESGLNGRSPIELGLFYDGWPTPQAASKGRKVLVQQRVRSNSFMLKISTPTAVHFVHCTYGHASNLPSTWVGIVCSKC